MDLESAEELHDLEQYLIQNGASDYVNYFLRFNYELIRTERVILILAPINAALQRLVEKVGKSLDVISTTTEGKDILTNFLSSSPFADQYPVYIAINGTTFGGTTNDLNRLKFITHAKIGNIYVVVMNAVIKRKDQQMQVLANLPQTQILTNLPQIQILTNLPQNVAQITNCGYTDWNKMIQSTRECNSLSRGMGQALVGTLSKTMKTNQDIIFYRSHYGDSVKNDPDIPEQLSFLTNEFKALSYDEKVEFLLKEDLTNREGINYKQWPLQQWGKNVIKYSQLTNKHLIYVQSDLWHCSWPSTFAEAMCNNLFTGYKHYPGSGFHFYGNNIDLFCVGDYSIIGSIKSVITQTMKKPIQYFHAEVTDWLNMTNRFLLSIYSSQPYNTGKEINLVKEWMTYPSIVWKNLSVGTPARGVSGKMIYISGPPIPFQNVMTVGDLNRIRIQASDDGPVNYAINLNRISHTVEKLEISLLFNTAEEQNNLTIILMRQMGVTPTGNYNLNSDIIYDGTVTDPIVIIDNVPIVVPKQYPS